ncbi:hypothetical protein BJ508DRAFT_305817 [Ascobolus immersus RN42]|uniref:Uncharacterized protein n=1 Tax=Ascobolus immersus RN42 TaxID=1160509 RepID=A0A3N4I7W0_ASCIM|nr:hypothetical protein BJ508DRAFT_305817 [Ascobolus immersus RN42]
MLNSIPNSTLINFETESYEELYRQLQQEREQNAALRAQHEQLEDSYEFLEGAYQELQEHFYDFRKYHKGKMEEHETFQAHHEFQERYHQAMRVAHKALKDSHKHLKAAYKSLVRSGTEKERMRDRVEQRMKEKLRRLEADVAILKGKLRAKANVSNEDAGVEKKQLD